MRKIYSFMVGAVAMFAAVSCAQELKQDNQLPEGEVVVFEATVDGADTKAHLDGKVSKWDADDQITIHNGTKPYTFTTKESAATARFTYVGNDFYGEKFMAVYPAGNWTADVEAKTVNAYIPTWQQAEATTYHKDAALAVAYSEDTSLSFKNATTLLKFEVADDNVTHVIFHGNNAEGITGNVEVKLTDEGTVVNVLDTEFDEKDNDGNDIKVSKKASWVECYAYHDDTHKYFAKETPYYIAVAPQTFEKGVTVKVRINEGEEKFAKVTSKSQTLQPSKIVNLGTIQYDAKIVNVFEYGLVGSFQGWDVANPVEMKYSTDGWIYAEGVELYKDDEFKFVKDKKWDVSYGTSAVTVLEEDKETVVVTSGSQNMKVSKNGKYNLYLNPSAMKVKVECVEEYSDLMVDITIDNKANWSPLYITLWDGNTPIVENAVVTDNKYSISGKYIGASLTCQLSNGSKVSEKMNVSITKTGSTLTLEETIIKLYFKLVESNQQTYWGDTSYIYVWGSGSSLDHGWPGIKMTKESENYTWSIIIPSELVGKTINFIINTGKGWQSPDSKITISAEGNTVTDKSLGIK